MSTIESCVPAIQRLEFNTLPSSKKVKITAAVRVDKTTVLLDTTGRVYSSKVRDRCHYTIGLGLEDTIKACLLLGVITKDEMRKHLDQLALISAKRSRGYAANDFVRAAKELGLRLTSAQLAAIEAAEIESGATDQD